MTVLETEEEADKRSVPPRKKFCLSLSGRGRVITNVTLQPPQSSGRGGHLDTPDLALSIYTYFLGDNILSHSF